MPMACVFRYGLRCGLQDQDRWARSRILGERVRM